MEKKLLFNPNGTDDVKKIINGRPTNTFDLYNIQHKWAEKAYNTMLANHWIPEKVNMLPDKDTYTKMTDLEKEAFLKILSFLIFLDSIQTNNLPNIADYVTSSEVVLALSLQCFQEANHSKSYGHIMTSIFDKDTAEKAIYYWRDDKVLLDRNSYIAKIYQDFVDNPSDQGFVRVVIANYLLEGLYFYNGFNFFYNLAARGFMTSTATEIKYINRDELSHCYLFMNIINGLREEEPELMKSMEDEIYEMFRIAADQEIKFSCHAIGNNVIGITEESIRDYTHFIGNFRLKAIKMNEIFPKCKNPYKHLEALAGVESEASSKTNNFEATSTSYKQENAIDGWDDL